MSNICEVAYHIHDLCNSGTDFGNNIELNMFFVFMYQSNFQIMPINGCDASEDDDNHVDSSFANKERIVDGSAELKASEDDLAAAEAAA